MTMQPVSKMSLASEVEALKLRKAAEQRQVDALQRDLDDVQTALDEAQRRLQTESARLVEAERALEAARARGVDVTDPEAEAAADAREGLWTAWETLDG